MHRSIANAVTAAAGRAAATATAVIVLVGLCAGVARADTLIVDAACTPPVGCDCNEIQPCVDMASAGDTVLVAAGTYTTQETRMIDVGGSPVTFTANVFMRDQVHLLAGPGDPLPLIDAGGTGVCIVADQVGAGTILEGFQILNGNASGAGFNSVGGGMLCLGSDLTIQSNIFTSNQAGAQGGGLACEEGSSPRVDNNLFDSNQAGTDGGAILCLGGAATIVGNIFSLNTTGDVGAAIRYVASGEISDNVFRDNQNTGGSSGAIVMRGGAAQARKRWPWGQERRQPVLGDGIGEWAKARRRGRP